MHNSLLLYDYVCGCFQIESSVTYFLGLAIVLNFINVDWVYQGIEEYAYIAKRGLYHWFVFFVCIYKIRYNTYVKIYCLSIGGINLLNIINLRKYKVSFILRNISVKRDLKPIFILLA